MICKKYTNERRDSGAGNKSEMSRKKEKSINQRNMKRKTVNVFIVYLFIYVCKKKFRSKRVVFINSSQTMYMKSYKKIFTRMKVYTHVHLYKVKEIHYHVIHCRLNYMIIIRFMERI